jgi:hypothetical protein
MPHINQAREMSPIYNVDEGVGNLCPNKRADVFLVQYFIKVINDRYPLVTRPFESPGPLLVDGYCSSNTEQWIQTFQRFVNIKLGWDKCVLDGRVNRANKLTGSLRHQVFTILHLNIWFQRVRPADHLNLALARDCPPEVLKSFILE